MTNVTRRTAVTSWSGLPSVAMMSASIPGAIVPIWLPRRSDSADRDVAVTMASIGAWPPSFTR